MWLLGEMHKPNQLDFESRGLDEKKDLQQETWNYFEDARLTGQVACGIVKSFNRGTVEWVWEQGGKTCQMIRNPISKCGGRVVRLDRKGPASDWFEGEYKRKPETRADWIEGHMIWVRRRFYDRYIKRASKNPDHYPLIRLEDLNQSMGIFRRGKYFKRWIEWLTQVEWPQWYIDSIQANFLPNQYYNNRVDWRSPKEAKERGLEWDRYHIESVVTEVHPTMVLQDRTKHFPIDPESWIYWEDCWDNTTKELYKKWLGDIDVALGYNHEYPGSLTQDWQFHGAFPWGELDEKTTDRAF
jgi:hypothetical protein